MSLKLRTTNRKSESVERWLNTLYVLVFSCVLLTQTNKQQAHPSISLCLLLSMFVSHPPALPLLSFSIFCSLPPLPPSKGHLHHLFLPAGHIFCFFVFFFFGIRVCSEASYSLDHIRQPCRRLGHSHMWETGEGILGVISEAVGGGVNLRSGYLSAMTKREQGGGVNSPQAQRRCIFTCLLFDSCPVLAPVFAQKNQMCYFVRQLLNAPP